MPASRCVTHSSVTVSIQRAEMTSRCSCSLYRRSTPPQRPVRGYSEAYYRLLRSLGILSSQSHALAVSKRDFNTNSFCLATDCEKVSTVQSSGQNVQGVDTRISGSFLSNGLNQANGGVDRVFFHMHYQVFIEIRAGSVTVLT